MLLRILLSVTVLSTFSVPAFSDEPVLVPLMASIKLHKVVVTNVEGETIHFLECDLSAFSGGRMKINPASCVGLSNLELWNSEADIQRFDKLFPATFSGMLRDEFKANFSWALKASAISAVSATLVAIPGTVFANMAGTMLSFLTGGRMTPPTLSPLAAGPAVGIGIGVIVGGLFIYKTLSNYADQTKVFNRFLKAGAVENVLRQKNQSGGFQISDDILDDLAVEGYECFKKAIQATLERINQA
jgi:hypothetical protein